MASTVERVTAVFEHQDQRILVRGELWLGRSPFQELLIDDNLEGHLNLRKRLGMDLTLLLLQAWMPISRKRKHLPRPEEGSSAGR